MDKKNKGKKKVLQETLAKVLELEKLKYFGSYSQSHLRGDNLEEDDLLSIPNYIDFTQGPVILSGMQYLIHRL